jgi:two-component system phosphate regulon sensor histidine kinase PhoR
MVLQGFSGDISETQRGLLQSAYAGNERQLYIINEMLHVAKVDSGRITLAKKKIDLTKLVKEVIAELKPDLQAAGHTIKTSYPKKPLIMNIDEHMLRMAIENLLSNAIKYTPMGGKIEVSVAVKANRARIMIRDNGVGIATNDISKLYKFFTRIDNSMTETVGGTGVGLYLSKHLVELHHGRIITESTPDKGSTFTISLPYRRL